MKQAGKKVTGYETGRYSVFIEPIFYLSELFYEVSIYDNADAMYIKSETLDDYTQIINTVKKYTKEIMNL